jgi:hypothetical protein
MQRLALVVASSLVLLGACAPRTTQTRVTTTSQRVVDVTPTQDSRFTWVTVAKEERKTVYAVPDRPTTSRAHWIKVAEDANEIQSVWLCYRDSSSREPRCYPPRWHGQPTGPATAADPPAMLPAPPPPVEPKNNDGTVTDDDPLVEDW